MALGSQPRWTVRPADTAVGIDVGLREYMLRVYNYMASGLALTGIVAYVAAASGFYESIARTPLIWLVILAPLGLVMLMSFGVQRMQASTLQLVFWGYSALMGLSMAMVFIVFTHESVARVFFITAGTFGAMSLYGYTTQARPVAVRLVPVHGADRHHHRLAGQHLHRLDCAAIRHLGDRRPRLRRADRV